MFLKIRTFRGQNCFCTNSKILFTFFTVLSLHWYCKSNGQQNWILRRNWGSGTTQHHTGPVITVLFSLHLKGVKNEKKLKVKSLNHVWLFVTPWTVAHQDPPSMGFSRQEYWSGLPFHFPGDLPDPGIDPRSPTLQADALTSEPPGKPLLSCLHLKGVKNTSFN